ncbi:hypothetical protein Q9L58_009661 [Maublancomyces gigas]|uniref:Uncharacterized protein n=1 Tax=Discina gigas TaxID=1032678 RepID=A0ABR3G6B9_9PEZI
MSSFGSSTQPDCIRNSSTTPNGHEPTSPASTHASERPTEPETSRTRTDQCEHTIDTGLSKEVHRMEFRLDGFENSFNIKNQENDARFGRSRDEVNRLNSVILSQGKLLEILGRELYLLRGEIRNKRPDMGSMERRNRAMVTDLSTMQKGMATMETGMATMETGMATMETDVMQYQTGVREMKGGMVMMKADIMILHTDLMNIRLDMTIMKKEMEAYVTRLFNLFKAEM